MSHRVIAPFVFCAVMLYADLLGQAPKPFQSAPYQRALREGDLGVSISTMMKDSWAFKGEVVLLETALHNEEGLPEISYIRMEELSAPQDVQVAQQWGELPLTYFAATSLPIGVVVNWEAPGNPAVRSYELLKRVGEGPWEVIGEVIASDNEEHLASYQLMDVNADQGVGYYGLKQRYHSGAETYSQHIVVDRFEEGAQYTYTYPNPYVSGITLAFQLDSPQPIHIVITNEANEVIAEMQTDRASKGDHLIELDFSTLPKQAYYGRIKTGIHEQRIPLTE